MLEMRQDTHPVTKTYKEEMMRGKRLMTHSTYQKIQQQLKDDPSKASEIGYLHDVVFISPRQETDVVGIGNKVTLRFPGEDNDEVFHLLSSDDFKYNKSLNTIPVTSPLGEAVENQPPGIISFKTPEGRQLRVEVKKIEPGSF